MNWQKFIGIVMVMTGISYLANDWKSIICCVLIGVGGVIYGDAD